MVDAGDANGEPDWSDPSAVRDFLLAEYHKAYKAAKDIGSDSEKDTDRISANRAAQSALDALAKLAGVADIRSTEGVRYTIIGLPSPPHD